MTKQLTRQSITLALTLLFAVCFAGLFAMPAAAESPYDNWNAAAMAAQATEGETLNDYTLDDNGKTLAIHTARGLAYFAQQVNSDNTEYQRLTVTLTQNIDLRDVGVAGYDEPTIAAAPTNGTGINNSWVPIGKNDDIPFKCDFDGQDHTISGVYINSVDPHLGLFGYASESFSSGKIENLGVIDSSITSTATTSSNYVGGVVGYNDGADLTNCYFDGTVTIHSGSAGGVVGYINTAYAPLTNCYNKGNITAIAPVDTASSASTVAYIGGVVGQTTASLTGCYNTGTITGGITGGIAGSARNNNAITNCYNTGAVHSNNSNVGGIVGNGNKVTISSCYNTGEITNSFADTIDYVGGIVGNGNAITITNCYNTANVTSQSGHVGGIGGSLLNSRLQRAYNTGTIVSTNSSKTIGSVIGVSLTSTVQDCY